MKPDLDEDIFDLERIPLDKAWNEQAKLYWHYAKLLADAREAWEQSKRDRDLVYAELGKDIRLHPSKYDLAKTSEESIKQTITICKNYQESERNVIKAKHQVDILVAFVEAIDQRKRGLESKTTLWVHEYWAECTPPKGEEAREKVNEMHKKEIRKRSQMSGSK